MHNINLLFTSLLGARGRPKASLSPQIAAWGWGGHSPFVPSLDPPPVIMQQQSFNRASDIALKRLFISLLISSYLRIIGYCGSTSLGFGSVLCYMKNIILYKNSCLNMSTAAKRSTMSKNVDGSSFFKKIE